MWIDGLLNNDVPAHMSTAAAKGFLAAIEALPGDGIKTKHGAYLELVRRINAPRIIQPTVLIK